jgi:hypothetical protein
LGEDRLAGLASSLPGRKKKKKKGKQKKKKRSGKEEEDDSDSYNDGDYITGDSIAALGPKPDRSTAKRPIFYCTVDAISRIHNPASVSLRYVFLSFFSFIRFGVYSRQENHGGGEADREREKGREEKGGIELEGEREGEHGEIKEEVEMDPDGYVFLSFLFFLFFSLCLWSFLFYLLTIIL